MATDQVTADNDFMEPMNPVSSQNPLNQTNVAPMATSTTSVLPIVEKKSFFRQYKLILLTLILLIVISLGITGLYLYLGKQFLLGSKIYVGQWISSGKGPIPAKIQIKSSKPDNMTLMYSWGDDFSGGYATIEAKKTTPNSFEWLGWGDNPPKYQFTFESDGTLKGIRTESNSTSTIIMK